MRMCLVVMPLSIVPYGINACRLLDTITYFDGFLCALESDKNSVDGARSLDFQSFGRSFDCWGWAGVPALEFTRFEANKYPVDEWCWRIFDFTDGNEMSAYCVCCCGLPPLTMLDIGIFIHSAKYGSYWLLAVSVVSSKYRSLQLTAILRWNLLNLPIDSEHTVPH